MAKEKVLICPYCGETQPQSESCRVCRGLFDVRSRQASHNAMGPWFVRVEGSHYQPGCSYEMLLKMIDREQVDRYTIIRGPTTKQFWTVARHVAGIAHLLGYCHQCDTHVDSKETHCSSCGVPFGAYLDRQHLGLPDIFALPGDIDFDPRRVASSQPELKPSPPGISSFASDTDLHAPIPPSGLADAPVSKAADDPEESMTAVESTRDDEGSSIPSSEHASPEDDLANGSRAVQLMRQQLYRRQRANARLKASLACALLAVVILLLVNRDNIGESLSPGEGSPSPSVEGGRLDPDHQAREESQGNAGDASGSIASKTIADAARSEIVDEPEGDDLPGTADEPVEEEDPGLPDTGEEGPATVEGAQMSTEDNALYEEALAMIGQARDRTRTADARITAFDRAIELLQGLVYRLEIPDHLSQVERRLRITMRDREEYVLGLEFNVDE